MQDGVERQRTVVAAQRNEAEKQINSGADGRAVLGLSNSDRDAPINRDGWCSQSCSCRLPRRVSRFADARVCRARASQSGLSAPASCGASQSYSQAFADVIDVISRRKIDAVCDVTWR